MKAEIKAHDVGVCGMSFILAHQKNWHVQENNNLEEKSIINFVLRSFLIMVLCSSVKVTGSGSEGTGFES